MRPPAVLLWVAATTAATAVAWAAVAQVTAATVRPLPAGAIPAVPIEAAPTSPPPGHSPDTVATAPPTTAPRGPAGDDAAAAALTRTYQLTGGDVTIAFSPEAVDVVSVTPRPGYHVKDLSRHGPLDVEVEFRGDGGRSRLRAWWGNGGPQQRIDEDD